MEKKMYMIYVYVELHSYQVISVMFQLLEITKQIWQ